MMWYLWYYSTKTKTRYFICELFESPNLNKDIVFALRNRRNEFGDVWFYMSEDNRHE